MCLQLVIDELLINLVDNYVMLIIDYHDTMDLSKIYHHAIRAYGVSGVK